MARGETYRMFVEKFEPKKTTDDCMTPEPIYEAVASWVSARYGIERADMVRPFWPGGDFLNYEYPDGCTVVDNPPFSILKKICDAYHARGIHYFLFAPGLTCLGTGRCAVCAMGDITYENGANVRTSFVTDLEEGVVAMSAPDLHDAIEKANDEVLAGTKNHVPRYQFPVEVITASRLGWMSCHGTQFTIPERGSCFIRTLDAMRAAGKSGVFGGGLLLSSKLARERAAAEQLARERAAAEQLEIRDDGTMVWRLSRRERDLVEYMDGLA